METVARVGEEAFEKVPTAHARPLRRLVKRRGGAISVSVLGLIVLSAALAPLIVPSPNELDVTNQFAGPSAQHWLGTDELGRDLLSRILHGSRLALGIAVGAMVMAIVIGIIWGGTAAVRGGWIDESLMRLVDAAMAIPLLLFALVFVAAFGSSLASLIVIVGILHAPPTARVVRAAVLSELHTDYCLAATAYGASRWRILYWEVLPNTVPTLVVQATLIAANAILIEATLSFLGLGVQPPSASWGTLLLEGYNRIYSSLAYPIFPGVMVLIAIWALNTMADNLQAVLDPRQRWVR